ncbi:MAG TPA: N-acetyl-gamma-glutamyl-phosphate reductase [Candidatus Dormibacteraeota bacterium]|jgi:N-acetyl-gamma-glutamyl-phosphate reductase|nr:N-acetyl-gamma-glutamyl-phosphate reductase [Candidatus Dormibacteraeota bacterium]
MPATVQPAIVGATGYAGFELARLLLRHPLVKKPALFTREGEGKNPAQLDHVYPHVSGNGGYPLESFSWEALRKKGVDVLFLATPHEVSREWTPEALRQGVQVVDLSGAWRINTPAYRDIYKFHDNDPQLANELTQKAVYGIPELHRGELKQASLVANAGCYATSIILALAPLVRAGLLDLSYGVICDSKSGVSGAGKQPTQKTHFVEVAENLSAYSVFSHRHTGEILEQLGLTPEQLVFTPHLLPIPRGILSTIYVRLNTAMESQSIENLMREFYAGSPWVRIFAHGQLPQIQYSLHTNYCDIGFTLSPERRRMVMVSCLDNLMKGAAGQAVQNMNLMFGWDEEEGLR